MFISKDQQEEYFAADKKSNNEIYLPSLTKQNSDRKVPPKTSLAAQHRAVLQNLADPLL